MQLRHRVALNGVQLDELDDRIIVNAVDDGAGRETLGAVSRFGGVGQRLTQRHRDTLDVTVRFALSIKASAMEERAELFEKVAAWATGGGWLTLNYRPNRRLYVVCAQLPSMGDLAEWVNEYPILFRAYGVPYWQQQTPETLSVSSTRNTTRTLNVKGSAPSVLDVTFANLSGMEIATVSIGADASLFELNGLGLEASETLVIDHTAEGLLRIRIKSASGAWRSAMGRRTEGSSDDLTVNPGDVTVTFAAQRAGRLTVSCFGRYA